MAGSRRWIRIVAPMVAAFVAAPAVAESQEASILAAIVRDEEPVVIHAAALPELADRPIDEIVVARWNGALGQFEPVPFQIDERIEYTFDTEPVGATFVETIHDIYGLDDGRLDALDEIVVRFADGGAQAPLSAWLPFADAQRFEVVVTDPRPDAPVAQRRFYLFTGHGLPTTPATYVSWSGAANASVESSSSELEFTDRWLMTGYQIEPPCGAGLDLIDRFKGRAGRNLDNESEQDWNATSLYMGGYSGPIRAIRYVRGAASAVNTVHYDVMYQSRWDRIVLLRVHALPAIALYFDLLPAPNARLFTAAFPAGLAVDGVPEPGGTAFQAWSVVRSMFGGFVVLYDVPPSPFYGSKRNFYKDDASYDDAISPFYDDEDDSAFGNHGFEIHDVTSGPLDRIDISLRMYPLCSGVGDAEVGAAYQALKDQPLAVAVSVELKTLAPIRSLRLIRFGADVVLDWDVVPGATSYLVMAAPEAGEARETWDLLTEVGAPPWVDAGSALLEAPRHYSVLGVTPSGTTPW